MRRTAISTVSVVMVAIGVGIGLMGVMAGESLIANGDSAGRAAAGLPSLAPLLAIVAGVIVTIAGLLLPLLRGPREESTATVVPRAEANAPILVNDATDEVTFVWPDARVTNRATVQPRALTRG